MTTTAYVDAPAGCSGDMFLAALLDAGLPRSVLEEVPTALGLADVHLHVSRVMRGALAATKVDVHAPDRPADVPVWAHDPRHGAGGGPSHGGSRGPDPGTGRGDDHGHDHGHEHGHDHEHDHAHGTGDLLRTAPHAGHRRLAEVLALIRGAKGLPPEALGDAARAFTVLAEAEARVHGVTPDQVHFHEVGALDALVDVVGTCVGLRRLGVREVRVSPLPWGSGAVRMAHGVLPLPAPAVLHLLEGFATFPSGETYEQITPTGAALLRAVATGSGVPAGFIPRRVGLGAGTHPGGRLPNVLRLVIGDAGTEATPADAVLLETNLDDATGQAIARAIERLLAEGALDAWAVPATMKKGRPGVVLSALVAPADVGRAEALLFRETPTLGVRRRPVARSVLARRHVPVTTPFGEVRMKVRETPEGPEATPEHDDCRLLAERHGVALRRVIDAAVAAYAARDA